MEILIIISISIIGWIFIELLSKTKQKLPYGFTKDMVNKEYVDDANSLLKNSILYIIFSNEFSSAIQSTIFFL